MKRMLWALPAALVVLGGGWMVRADGAGAYLEPAASVRAYALGSAPASEARPAAVHYVRYRSGDRTAYGILEGETIRELSGDYFSEPRPTGRTVPLAAAALLSPLDPMKVSKVLGVAINTRRPGREAAVPHPRFFAKFPTSINDPDGAVELPPEATNLNYEGELVVVIGKRGRHIPAARAGEYIFGVTVGNDYSENTWYGERKGVEEPTRLISKATDGWAVMGPAIVAGIDYADLRVTTRLNGDVVQEGRTSDLVNDVPGLVSYVSRYVTLLPGDAIYTGTVLFREDARRVMRPGDVVEVEIEGIGALRSRIVTMRDAATED